MSDEVYRRQVARLFERSGFYREKLARAGFVSPRDAGGLADIAKLPFTEKDELRQNQSAQPPLGAHAAVDITEVARIYSTSGTSGAPLYIPLTKADVEEWREIGRKTYGRNGIKASDRVVTTFGAGPFVAGASLAAFEAIGCTHIPTGVGNTDKVLAALRQLEPQALACTPSYALYLSEKISGKTSIERIIVGGEPGGGEESFRRKLEQAWQAKVYEIMGIGDIAASLWGECPAQAGMHFSADGVIHVELIDPDSGKPVAIEDGAKGELVYTHLRREAAPMLRFRSRDHVQVWVSECICKRKTMRVRCIGRTDDMLIVRGVNVFPAAVREVVARFQPRVTGAILIRPKSRGVKQEPPLTVCIEGESDGALAEKISLELRNTLTFTPEVRLVPPQSLPRSDYKSKLVDYSEAK
ncbi:MAG TPA: phenylacetate--CoA ligase family protein [Burkholderiales bacterium]|nr:phenylacetate--CoA ligase family protein [Burkholderiales bacterium]